MHRRVPESAINALMASLADSSIRQYSRPLRSWWEFCVKHGYNAFEPLQDQVLEFLAEELTCVGSYSMLNTTRSAISLISINKIGDSALVKRFCKGVGKLKPPRPRYDHVWDPGPVIEKMKTLYPHDNLSLETLTKKLLILLALGSGQRCQTLSLLRISQIDSDGENLTIRVPDRIKTSGPGRAQPLLCFKKFKGHKELCIYRVLYDYIQRTENLRSEDCDFLFIALKKPHNAVCAQTIGRWIRATLVECGIDKAFGAHSTRHASTSSAAEKGVTVDIINRAAGWSGDSRTFARFYNRPIVDRNKFSSVILCNDD